MERKKIFDILDIISTVLIIPVLILGLFCSILMYNAKHQNGVPSLFGSYAVTIRENITTEEHPEFTEGAKVLVSSVNPEDLQPRDFIAFYSYVPPVEEGEEQEPSTVEFRMIIEVYTQENEETQKLEYYFVTGNPEGEIDQFQDTDGSMKTAYISQDYVIGKYSQSEGFATNFFTFCGSTTGIITIVLIPAAVVLILAGISFVEQIVRSNKEKNQNRKKLIEAEKMLQGETLVTAGNMNLNSNIPPKTQNANVPPKAPNASVPPKSTNTSVLPKAPNTSVPSKAPVTSSQTASTKQSTKVKTASSSNATPPKTPMPPKASVSKTATPPKAPEKPSTPPKAQVKPSTPPKAPVKPSTPPKAQVKPATPPKPSTPPSKPTDKK